MGLRPVYAAVFAFGVAAAFAPRARADALAIDTVELGPWQNAVAALESDVTAEGRTIHVRVHDASGTQLSCGAYALQLDDVGRAAFATGACDPVTGATALTLARRTDLFSHDGVIPRPRVVGITAVEVLSGGASGGAGLQSGSTMHCTIDVHPYVVDQEHGTHVALFAPRFALRVQNASVTAAPTGDGWTLGADTSGRLSIGYDVVDVQSGEVVVTDHAELVCGAQPVVVTPAPGVTVVTGSNAFVSGGVVVGTSPVPVPTVHPDTRDAATPAATTPATSDDFAVWVGLSMHAYGSHLLGNANVESMGLTRPVAMAPLGVGQWDMGFRFSVSQNLYLGFEWGMLGVGGPLSAGGDGALTMSFTGLLGARTSGGPVSLFGELAAGGVAVLGEDMALVDGSTHHGDGPFFGVVDARIGLDVQLGEGLYTRAYFGLDVLDPASMSGGLAIGVHG